MSYLLEHARALGCTVVHGNYIPTAKNNMVSGFYPELGFKADGQDGEARRFVLDISADPIEWPKVIRRKNAR
jgi:predicted enzyme involved in methoxymalonyl-ACP biosynthesis